MISSSPGICGGRPCLAGTRVPVHRVAGYFRLGYAPEEIPGLLSSLTLAQVYAALAHALAHPQDTDDALRAEEQALSHLKSQTHAAPAGGHFFRYSVS